MRLTTAPQSPTEDRCGGCQAGERLISCLGCGKPTCICQDTSLGRHNIGQHEPAFCLFCHQRRTDEIVAALGWCTTEPA